jgi:fructokinase
MSEKKLHHPVVCFGEVLWDILPNNSVPGGAPMNVAYHLQKLGKNPAVITRIGCDEMGKQLQTIFSDYGVCTDFFQVDDNIPTGKVYAEFIENNEVAYNIVKPLAWDLIEWQDELLPLIKEAEYFVFGSLSTRTRQSRNTLFSCLESANTKVLDINMRPPHYNKKIVEELLTKADILKLNLAELHLITGWFSDYTSDEERIKLLKEKFNLETIIVTKGGDGAILNIGSQFYSHPGYIVEVADTVGSGDAFLAGTISKLIDRAPPQETLDFASKLGAFIATCKGACPQYSPESINEINSLSKPKILID